MRCVAGSPPTAAFVVRNATVVDPRDGSLTPGQDVHIADRRIAKVCRTDRLAEGSGDVDATGRYVVPGYADMHAHPLNVKDPGGSFDLMLAYGVTGFRHMSGSNDMLDRRGRGELMPQRAPRLLSLAGPLLTPLNTGSNDAVVAAIREQKDRGADFVKAAVVTPAAFEVAQAEAARLGIPILGHLPVGIDALEASARGMRSIEHLGPGIGILSCCSPAHDDLVAGARGRPQPKLPPISFSFLEPFLQRIIRKIVINPANRNRQADIDLLERAAATFDEDAAAQVAAQFRSDSTWQVPTLIRSRTSYLCDDPAYRDDPNLRYLAPSTRREWDSAAKKFDRFSDAAKQTYKAVYAVFLQLTKVLDDAGVRMLAGSDASGAIWEIPGAALHQEFDELALAGLSPLRILQMTTSDAAEFLGATADMGSVDAGKYADLVLLDANPLESVANLHAVSGVVSDGVYYSGESLAAMKDAVASGRSVY